MPGVKRPLTISGVRYLKDDVNSYSETVIDVADKIDANFILVSFTGTSGEERERWNKRPIRPFVQKAHARDKMVTFYMKFTNIMWKPMFHERPESKDWIMVYANGKPALYGGSPDRYMGCLNNPGWRQHLKDTIDEAVEYEPDALFYDNCFVPRELKGTRDDESAASGWACYCDICREKFKQYTKRTMGWECALPVKPDWDDPVWQAFIEFRDEYFTEVMQMIVDHAHSRNPDILVYPNVAPPWMGGGGAKGSASNMIADKVDLLLLERSGAPRAESPPAGGLPRAVNAAIDWKYGWRITGRPVWYRMNKPGSYTPDQMKIGLAEAAAFNGATHHIMASLLLHEHEKAQAIRHNYGFIQRHTRFYDDVKPVADVAVHISTPTINWYYPDRVVTQGATDPPRTVQGFSQALVESHIPFNAVIDADMDRGDHGYKAVILPGVTCMSDAQAEAIRQYVKNGGAVVATGNTSLFDERYRARKDFALADLFGVHYGQPATDLVTNTYGKGRVAYLPGTPDEEFWQQGKPATLALLKRAVAYALDDKWQLELDAPPTTLTNVTETADGSATMLHMINFDVQLTETQKAFGANETPQHGSTLARTVADIPVKLRAPEGKKLKSAFLLAIDIEPERIEIEAKQKGETVSFTVPLLKIYDVVVLEWE